MGFWSELFGLDSPTKPEIVPSEPTLYDEQIPDTFNLGWHYSENKNQYQMAKISNKDRNSHFYVVGSTGVGKSKFLQYLIMQDILEGRGVGVIDPHGDLIEDLKGLLVLGLTEDKFVETLSNSIILIDPTDPKYTVSFNPLEKLSGVSAVEQANELVSSFKKIWADSWGVRMEELMRNSLIALCEAELTLADLSTFLTNKNFRETVQKKVTNHIAYEYFERFNLLSDKATIPWTEPITNKINAVFADDRIRDMFSSPKSTFNFREAMDKKKVILVKLDKGRLKDASNLLGALLVAKIQMAAFSRSDVDLKKRVPFYLYIDEFQNFASESFSVILSEARKYGLYLTMAHQSLSQVSSELRDLILSCAGIQVYFRQSRQDAQTLSKEAFSFGGDGDHALELQNLPPRVCYVKNKIHGGLIPISSVPIEEAHEVLEMPEEEFRSCLNRLPFGQKYLIERSSLAPHVAERRDIFVKDIPKKRSEEKPTQPIQAPPTPAPVPKEPPRPRQEVHPEKPKTNEKKDFVSDEKDVSRHQYLQSFIKRMAEDKGYKAVIEQPTSLGSGRIDVGLEKSGKKIAIEISVTTTSEHELSNIEKCLNDGYNKVIMVSHDKRNLEKIRTLAKEKLADSGFEKVMFFEPEELFFYLEEESAKESGKEDRMKGYKVTVNFQPQSENDKKRKKEAVAQVMLGAFRRLKGKG